MSQAQVAPQEAAKGSPVTPERGISRPPPRSHLGETYANVACRCVGCATRCFYQLRVKPKMHEDELRSHVWVYKLFLDCAIYI